MRGILATAGFDAIDVVAVDHPFWLGTDAEDAFGFVRTTGIVRGLTNGLDDEQRARALDVLHATIVEHDRSEGVAFGSGAWLDLRGGLPDSRACELHKVAIWHVSVTDRHLSPARSADSAFDLRGQEFLDLVAQVEEPLVTQRRSGRDWCRTAR